MSQGVDSVVVGAGVVGLAIARALARSGREVILLESESDFGTGTSARNSEVIHAGIYYAAGSLKAQACVSGRARLYEFCNDYGVEHRRCEKLIVATSDAQLAELESIHGRGQANGVDDLQIIEADQARRLEPHLRCQGALLSPSTGIVDSHGLMLALLGDAEAHGAVLATNTPFLGATVDGQGFRVRAGGAEPMQFETRELVNSAGLASVRVAGSIEGLQSEHVPELRYAKGNYFTLGRRAPFTRLIYPVPEDGGLGVHLTLDLAGIGRFGPDVEWTDSIDYQVDPLRCSGFYAAIRRYWPDLADDSLRPDYSGIRPKLSGPGQAARDFLLQGADTHGLKGLVNLHGIESPGLTSCLELADRVLASLEG